MVAPQEDESPTRGLWMAVLAYGLWGLFPIYWKQLAAIPAAEVLAHRVVWSLGFLVVALVLLGRFRQAAAVMAEPRKRWAMLASTSLIAVNWGIFIWAVSVGRVTEASLGYYINPLINVALGRVLLGEKLRPFQAVAVALALGAVIFLTLARGELPWVSLLLAVTFSCYGLIRKRAPIAPLEGLAIETGLAAPVAILYLALLEPPLGHLPAAGGATATLLIASGVVTAIPLLAFASAARRLRYTTLGMVQYLAPTMQLGTAVLLYGEPFRTEHAVAFSLIWCAVAIYVADSLRRRPEPIATRAVA